MATAIMITPEGFGKSMDKVTAQAGASGTKADKTPRYVEQTKAGRFDHVRRPLRGIELKNDTYATIQVRTSDGRNIPLIDAAGRAHNDGSFDVLEGYSTHYSNFLIQNITEQRAEKSQVVITFGEPYIFFFGEQPRILTVQGVLLNTNDFNWRAEFWENYDNYLRGTKCVQNKTRVYLSWDDIVVEGYISQADAQDSAPERNFVTFSFQMFLTDYQNISNIGSPTAHLDGKNINLDPSQIDTMLSATTGFQSSSLAVRQANVAKNLSQSSLLGMLRDGQLRAAFTEGMSRLVAVQDKIQDILNIAGSYVGGRNVRVPIGYTGGAVYDEVQLSLASVTPNNGQVELKGMIGGQMFQITGAINANRTTSVTYGALWLNKDEFVSQELKPLDLSSQFLHSFEKNKYLDVQAMKNVENTFKAFGVDVEPPNEVLQTILSAGFKVTSLIAGKQLSKVKNTSVRQAWNTIPGALI